MTKKCRLVLACLGWLAGSAVAQAATPRDALVMAWSLDALTTLDPAEIGEPVGTDIIVNNVCTPLVGYDPQDMFRLIPGTAESWAISPDGLVLSFTLRGDLQFPDGRRATAEDAAWSLRRTMLLGTINAANFSQWGFTRDRIADQIRATDDRTLVVTMDQPYPVELILSALFAGKASVMLDRETGLKQERTIEGVSDLGRGFFKTGPVCVGPYRVTRWDANEVVVLERNAAFFGARPRMKRVIIRHVPESGVQRQLLENGDVDMARLLVTEDLTALQTSVDVRIVQTLMQGMSYVAMNTTDPVLANPKVREAFRYLIDYDGLARIVLPYQGTPRASLVPLGAFGALDAREGAPFSLNLDKARALLVKAGYPDGFSKKLILSANGVSPAVAQHLADNAAKVGIRLELEQLADPVLFARGRARDFQLQLVSWGAGYPDADAFVFRHAVNPDRRAVAKLAQYPVWRTGWQDLSINAQAQAARMERDPARRIALYREIQQFMMHNGPMAYIYQTIRPIAVRATVTNLVMSPFGVLYGTAAK